MWVAAVWTRWWTMLSPDPSRSPDAATSAAAGTLPVPVRLETSTLYESASSATSNRGAVNSRADWLFLFAVGVRPALLF